MGGLGERWGGSVGRGEKEGKGVWEMWEGGGEGVRGDVGRWGRRGEREGVGGEVKGRRREWRRGEWHVR